MQALKIILVLLIATVVIGSSYSTVLASGAEAADSAALYEKKCSMCHNIERSKSKNKSEKSWRKTVTRMKRNGAPITDEEADIIIMHLADKYGK